MCWTSRRPVSTRWRKPVCTACLQGDGGGKTAFIVTHRIGSAQLADRILVFDKGKIVEQGTHEELIKSGGKYAFLYREQGKWY